MTDFDTETFGAKALTWAMIAGAALLFLEITWSPVVQAPPAKPIVAQTVSAHRLAQN
jgi:hypothetical protein